MTNRVAVAHNLLKITRADGLQTCLCIVGLALWQSGHAVDCKSLYAASIPARNKQASMHWSVLLDSKELFPSPCE